MTRTWQGEAIVYKLACHQIEFANRNGIAPIRR